MINMPFKSLADVFDVVAYLFDKKLCALLFFGLCSIELDDGSIVKVTYLFKTGLKNVSFDVLVDFCESFELCQYLRANHINIELVIILAQKISIDCAKSPNEQILDQQNLSVTYLIFKFFDMFLLDHFAHVFILTAQL